MKIRNQALSKDKELLELIKDEVNVKAVVFDEALKGGEIKLDIKITKELRLEGEAREMVRQIQDMRKEANLTRKDMLILATSSALTDSNLFVKFGDFIKKESLIKDVVIYDKKEKYLIEKETSFEDKKTKLAIKLKK